MIANLRKLLAPKSEKLVRIELSRNVFISGVTYSAGDIIEVPESTAKQLVLESAAIDREADQRESDRIERLNALLPPPGTARPVPTEWEHLPVYFATWWELNESGLLLLNRAEGITAALLAKFGSKTLPSLRTLEQLPIASQRKLIGTIDFNVGTPSQDALERERYLKDALERANRAFDDWSVANAEQLATLRFECSTYTIQRHGELVKACRDLSAIGRQIFEIRIGALALEPWKITDLYMGSSDRARFHIDPPGLQDLRLAWSDAGSDPVHYLDHPVPTMASLIAHWAAVAARVEGLAAEARKELARAKKAAASPALAVV